MAPKRRIPLIAPGLTPAMVAAATKALRTERFLRGDSVMRFEKNFGTLVKTRHAVALNNGTNALLFALQALKIRPGDQVLTTAATFIATANAIVMAGARPRFVDIDPATGNMDPQKSAEILEADGGMVRAILPVHLYGRPVELPAFERLARKNQIALIEDACQAHGAKYDGRPVGSWGDAGAFSFYPSKNLTVGGDGGMLTTNNDAIAAFAESVRDGGRAPGTSYVHERVGTTARLNTVNAAFGLEQLKLLSTWNKRRRTLAKRYDKALAGVPGLQLPPPPTDVIEPVYHLYVVRTKRREGLRNHLEKNGIEAGIHYPIPIHLQTPYKGQASGPLPETERWANEVLSLPMFPTLKEADQDRVIDAVRSFFAPGARA